MTAQLGVDLAKRKFDAALLNDGKIRNKVFENTPSGFQQLVEWLARQGATDVHVCMEATGDYGEALATFLHDAGYTVSMVNPAQIKGFAQSKLLRTKTDKANARLIAQFCQANTPPAWQPAPPEVRELQALARRLDALNEMQRMELNRLETAHSTIVPSLQAVLTQLEEQIKLIRRAIRDHIDQHPDLRGKRELLDSIPGIGEATITQILAYLAHVRFTNAKQVAAFLGLNPRQHQSGSSVRGKARISKTGDARLRKAFYLPAVVAMRYNPVIRAFSERLLAAGKPRMLVVGAVMRKLAHMVYGVLKSGQPFNPNLALNA